MLKFEINRKEGFSEGIDERGLLSTLDRLRDDLLLGDYRVLYLVWLKAREPVTFFFTHQLAETKVIDRMSKRCTIVTALQ